MLEKKIHYPTWSDDYVCNKMFQWLLRTLQHLCSVSLCETSSVCSSRWHRSPVEGQAKNLVHYWLTCSCVATCCPSIQRRKTWLQKMYSCQNKQETKPLNFASLHSFVIRSVLLVRSLVVLSIRSPGSEYVFAHPEMIRVAWLILEIENQM